MGFGEECALAVSRAKTCSPPQLVPESLSCRLYIGIVLLETVIDIALEADILAILDSQEKAQSSATDLNFNRLPVYLVVFGLAQCGVQMLLLSANAPQFVPVIISVGCRPRP